MSRRGPTKLFHYASEGSTGLKRMLGLLRQVFPHHTFDPVIRRDFRFYIWAKLPPGEGTEMAPRAGWVAARPLAEIRKLRYAPVQFDRSPAAR